jgi:membrane fusion protein, heavy metal efflux system
LGRVGKKLWQAFTKVPNKNCRSREIEVRLVQQISNIVLTLSIAALVGLGAWWIITSKAETKPTDKPASPATVSKIIKEDELNTVTLTEEAEKRIGLTVTAIEKEKKRRVRVYGGEVMIPVGRTILVSAPLTGVIKSLASGETKAGQNVKAGQVVFQLTPLLSPDGKATLSASLADAEGQVNNAKTQLELGKIALERAKRVLKEGAGSQRQVDEAQAAFDVSNKTLEATLARQNVLKKVIGDAEAGTANPINIEAPEAGLLRTVSALSGQTVPSGSALFEVIDLSTVWVRVALPVGDLEDIDRSVPAMVGKLAAQPGAKLLAAKPVAAPPSANALAATVDLYYELPNTDSAMFPGQRLGVTIPLADAKESLTVPWSAVVFDIHGGNWVYEQVAPHKFARKRVVVSHTSGTDAVLASGPAAATKVVTTGVQQLFASETGFVK